MHSWITWFSVIAALHFAPQGGADNATVVAIIKDSKALAALLNKLAEAEPVGIRTEAEPVGKPASRLKAMFAEPLSIVQFDYIEPINDVLGLVQVDGSGEYLLIYHPAEPVGRPGLVLGEELRIGTRVSLDLKAGTGSVRSLAKPGSNYTVRVLRKPAGGGKEASEAWEITPNSKLRGVTGRLIAKFPERTDSGARFFHVYKAGTKEEVHPTTTEPLLLPQGEYDVRVVDVILAKVPIKAGHDTRIKIGAVTFAGGGNTVYHVYDAKGEKELFVMAANQVRPMPVGKYAVKMGSTLVQFEIKDGEVTEL
ncbi:MAG TPA: hypothetical protein VNK96_02350 [Fimbriimonadales bacterium]|nr:hypothetical protein [Fimbriimonadales bacterium]